MARQTVQTRSDMILKNRREKMLEVNEFGLPPINDLIQLDVADRESLLVKLTLERRRRKQRAVELASGYPDPAVWIEENFYDPSKVILRTNDYSNANLMRLQDFQKRIIRHVLTLNPFTGRFPYRTIFYSAPKKSGKSTIGAAMSCYFARHVEAPNEIFILANTREQSKDRVFSFAVPTLKKLGATQDSKYQWFLPNGTLVKANTSDPEQEAGGSYGLTVWDELWAYKGERMRLLWDELMPVGTRNNSMRLIVTYAGFEDRSELLMSLYSKIFKNTKETELAIGARPVPGLEDIVTTDGDGGVIPCCYEVPAEGIFYFNDHEQRMPWQRGEAGEALRRETQGTLTPENAFRLLENRWQPTENHFIQPEIAKASFKPLLPTRTPMTFAIDASMRKDSCALVGVYPIRQASGLYRYATGFAQNWVPSGEGAALNINIKETVIAKFLELVRAGMVAKRKPESGEKKLVETERLTCLDVHYDNFQMHQIAMDLRTEHKILIREFPQGKDRLLADTFLRQQYEEHNIDNGDFPVLLSHLEAARAETQMDADQTRIRIVKANSINARHIDLVVAQSMCVWRCSQRHRAQFLGISQGSTRGW